MYQGYKKLLNDLELHKRLKVGFEDEYKYNQELFDESLRPGTRSTLNHKPIDRVVEDLKYYENLIYIETEAINNLEIKIKAIDECINKSDITVKVAQLRAMGVTQEQVAELVERSTSTIKRIDKKLKNDTSNELLAIEK